MLEGWGEYYLITGPSAAVLIGLLFVVITLTAGKDRSAMMTGQHLSMGPVVLHISLVLVISAAAVVPHLPPVWLALIIGAIALWGLIRSWRVVVGIRGSNAPHWSDVWCYGVVPFGLYLLLGGSVLGIWAQRPAGPELLAAVVMALLLISIRNAWDLVTWLAPRVEGPDFQLDGES